MSNLTTKHLEDIIAGRVFAFPGDQNAARYLLALATVEHRQRAVSRAHLRMNLGGGNYSGCVYQAVRETQQHGLEETPDEAWNRSIIEKERLVRL